MRNQLLAGFFYCLTAQATLFTVWANYHEGSLNPFSVLSTLAMWFSCYSLVRTLTNREYREQYQAIWNPWAIAEHPESIVRFGYGFLERPKLLVGGACLHTFVKNAPRLCMVVVRPRFFLFTHHLLRDSLVTQHLLQGFQDQPPTRRQRWYSWLFRAEYVTYQCIPFAGIGMASIRDVHGNVSWNDPVALAYYEDVGKALEAHWSSRRYLGYSPDLPRFLQ